MQPSPNETPSTEVPTYSPTQVWAASFIGSPIAAAILIARNERIGGNHSSARGWVWGGVIGTLLLFVMMFFLPENFPSKPIPIACSFLLSALADRLESRGRRGGLFTKPLRHSWWGVIGLAFACLAAVVALVFGVVFLLEAALGSNYE